MRRWSVVRTIGLAITAVVAIGVVYQLPASPLARHESAVPSSMQSSSQPSVQSSTRTVVPQRATIPPAAPVISYPVAGTQSYAVLPGDPAVIGRAGKLMRFQVAIEGGITGIDRVAFARFVRTTYGGAEGWASRGQWRFQQVGPGTNPDFTLMLVTPQTRDVICGAAPDRYTSCRIGNRVVLNVARWAHGVPNFGASLTTYRQYMVNHETGHRLGHGHELCPGPGQPAPVMQQQTLGLHGCTAYAWPYLNGQRYSGRLGQYDDPVPHP
ncbi:DUF3152 domain-containing protein [Kribbella kalugense]|uniref:Uncharacterized protein DUF3152 n=1 Tax=Kribbella kalugense TaxID=2512221 RepID=A0A4R7ZJP4_9ACTN|nr:DUF3152 domain-containing protein [Kribbella kalugense]TDW17989.1 uncharacterized protein DUF3152 [Kribbella kalugense]